MKKTFDVLSNQLERIYKLYLKGYGTKKMLEKAEAFMFGTPSVGLMF